MRYNSTKRIHNLNILINEIDEARIKVKYGDDTLKRREDMVKTKNKMPISQSWKNDIQRAWMKNDQRNKGTLRKPSYKNKDGKTVLLKHGKPKLP